LYSFLKLAAALLVGIQIWFAQTLGVEQNIEPAAFPVPPVVGDFHILYSVGVDILLHGPQVEEHGGLEVVEEHAVSFVEAVVTLGRDNECGPVRILKKGFLGSVYMLLLLGINENK